MKPSKVILVHKVTPERWRDLANLFERPGPRGGLPATARCWCIVWRDRSGNPRSNQAVLRRQVAKGCVPGLLAYNDGEPIGWISSAPQSYYAALIRSPRYRPSVTRNDLFVISCFYVHGNHRREGVATKLLDAAIEDAREEGAALIEAYPGQPPDYKGRLKWFLDRGFQPARVVGKRTVVRLSIK